MYAMCIRPREGLLTQGKIYEGTNVCTTYIYVLADDSIRHRFYISDFEVLRDIPTTLRSITSAQPTAPDIDDEERCWRALLPHIEKDECKCGIKRVMCDYHRDV